jgi:hypothetical protein
VWGSASGSPTAGLDRHYPNQKLDAASLLIKLGLERWKEEQRRKPEKR